MLLLLQRICTCYAVDFFAAIYIYINYKLCSHLCAHITGVLFFTTAPRKKIRECLPQYFWLIPINVILSAQIARKYWLRCLKQLASFFSKLVYNQYLILVQHDFFSLFIFFRKHSSYRFASLRCHPNSFYDFISHVAILWHSSW